jgi:hypothetical protein
MATNPRWRYLVHMFLAYRFCIFQPISINEYILEMP